MPVLYAGYAVDLSMNPYNRLSPEECYKIHEINIIEDIDAAIHVSEYIQLSASHLSTIIPYIRLNRKIHVWNGVVIYSLDENDCIQMIKSQMAKNDEYIDMLYRLHSSADGVAIYREGGMHHGGSCDRNNADR